MKSIKGFLEEVGCLKTETKQKQLFEVQVAPIQFSEINGPGNQITSQDSFEVTTHYVDALYENGIDITSDYHQWVRIAYAFANTYGELGRSPFHRVSSAGYSKYDKQETDRLFSYCAKQSLKREPGKRKVTIATFIKLAQDAGVKF